MHRMLAVVVLVAAPAAAQNLVVNGDFERTQTTGCEFNLSNEDFNALMPGCTGFGTWQGVGELDIMQGGACGYGLPAASGLVKVGIGAADDHFTADAFSFRLKSPLMPGDPYRLSFKATAFVSDFSPNIGPVEVGLSASPTDFGVKVGELVPSAVAWSSFDAIIVPAMTARFLTVRYPVGANGWNHVDDFSLESARPAGLTVSAEGPTIHVTGSTPGSLVAILISPAAGSGTMATLVIADGTGSATVEHGRWLGLPLLLQAVELSTRELSSVVTLDGCIPPTPH